MGDKELNLLLETEQNVDNYRASDELLCFVVNIM
jgi:hypothetical protein